MRDPASERKAGLPQPGGGARILLVEDEPAVAALLRYNLEQAGFRITACADGADALDHAREEPPDLILLDWMLPRLSGIEVCRRLRNAAATRDVPIIMLTARGEEADTVRGLDAGADDYVTKPFSPAELIARVHARLRREGRDGAPERLIAGDIAMDLRAHRVWRDGVELHLGPTEYRLLHHLMQHPDRVFSRAQLLDAVWGRDIFVEMRTVDAHIRRLRKTLNERGGADLIRTVRAAGYSFIGQGGDAG